jgi:hypothetical protein
MAAGKSTPELVLKAGIKRDDDKYLYYVDRQCNILRMPRGVQRAKAETLVVTKLKRERGFMYYLDDQGDLVREPDQSKDT